MEANGLKELKYFVDKKDLFRHDFLRISKWATFFLISVVLLFFGKKIDSLFTYVVYFPLLLIFVFIRYFFEDRYTLLINDSGVFKVRENGNVDSLLFKELADNSYVLRDNFIFLKKNRSMWFDSKFKFYVPVEHLKNVHIVLRKYFVGPDVLSIGQMSLWDFLGFAIRPWTIFSIFMTRTLEISRVFYNKQQSKYKIANKYIENKNT